MSNSSLHEPKDGDETSDSNVQKEISAHDATTSSRSQDVNPAPTAPDGRAQPDDRLELDVRASLKKRGRALERQREWLGRESVETYIGLLEEIAGEVSLDPALIGPSSHFSTQDGIVKWTPTEKELFFHLLARKGRDGIEAIARGIGTKSELEVADHLRLLHRGLMNQHLNEQHSRTIVLGGVPAAAEISEECCAVLERYAELLRHEEAHAGSVAGKVRHKNFWIVDRERAEEVEEQLENIKEVTQAASSIVLTGSLLNLKKWIQVSERFFMNFGGSKLEDNWVNVAQEGETPSLTADAFSDFYALTVTVTRRLVQSAIFVAMSRIRSMKEYRRRQKAQTVKPRDVEAAVNVLNMKRDSYDFWTGVPRRCHLNVADFRHRRGWRVDGYMDPNDVEDVLAGRVSLDDDDDDDDKRSVSRARGSISSQNRFAQEIASDFEAGSDDDFQPPDSPSSLPSSNALSSPIESSDEEEWELDPEEQHADLVDNQHSAVEEIKLWTMMRRDAPSRLTETIQNDVKSESNTRIRPSGCRKTREELADWRDRLLHRSEWEEYGHEIYEIDEEIAENRRKRRRIEAQRMASVQTQIEASQTMEGVDTAESNHGTALNEAQEEHRQSVGADTLMKDEQAVIRYAAASNVKVETEDYQANYGTLAQDIVGDGNQDHEGATSVPGVSGAG